MKIDFERLDRMAAAGAPAGAIIEALRVDFEREEARKVVKRPKDAARLRDKRKATRGDIVATSSDIERHAATFDDDGWPTDFREQFWSRYPHKVGKPKALAKLEGIRKRAVLVDFSAIIDGLARYIREKPPDRAWLNPETFLNGERWSDRPAPVSTGPPRRTGPQGFESLFQEPPDELAPRSEYDIDIAAN